MQPAPRAKILPYNIHDIHQVFRFMRLRVNIALFHKFTTFTTFTTFTQSKPRAFEPVTAFLSKNEFHCRLGGSPPHQPQSLTHPNAKTRALCGPPTRRSVGTGLDRRISEETGCYSLLPHFWCWLQALFF